MAHHTNRVADVLMEPYNFNRKQTNVDPRPSVAEMERIKEIFASYSKNLVGIIGPALKASLDNVNEGSTSSLLLGFKEDTLGYFYTDASDITVLGIIVSRQTCLHLLEAAFGKAQPSRISQADKAARIESSIIRVFGDQLCNIINTHNPRLRIPHLTKKLVYAQNSSSDQPLPDNVGAIINLKLCIRENILPAKIFLGYECFRSDAIGIDGTPDSTTDSNWANRLVSAARRVEVTADVAIRRNDISLQEITSLSPGSKISLNQCIPAKATLTIDGQQLYDCVVGHDGEYFSIEIL